MSDRVRVAISMRRQDYEALKREASDSDSTVAGYLRKALIDHRYLRAAVDRGATVLVEEAGTTREVVFR